MDIGHVLKLIISLPNKKYSTQRLLLGTHTSNAAPNYLQIAQVQLPLNNTDLDVRKYDEDRGGDFCSSIELILEIGGYNGNDCRINITQKIDHKGEVNRARYMPQNPDLIATMAPDGNVYIFDRTKHPNQPNGKFNPQIQLKGHEKEG
jgi:histone-binding protein RBBP4